MKKVISHIWPLTKRVPSQKNGILEITWTNGKKVLNSQNANYSYGALQKVLNYGLSKIELENTNEVLLLGLGGGSVIQSLYNRFNYKGRITAIEIDNTVIQIAKDEFDIKDSKQLSIIHENALSYVKKCKKQYDVIIIDIFTDQIVPKSFYKENFWLHISQLVEPGGNILFNAGILLKDHTKIENLKHSLKPNITFTQHNNVLGANTLLIGKKL